MRNKTNDTFDEFRNAGDPGRDQPGNRSVMLWAY